MRRWLKAGVREEGEVRTSIAGSPPGGVISPVLCNAYVHACDVAWETKARGAKLIRSCDDDVILCRGNPQPWFQRRERSMTGLGFTLNAEKTRIVDAAEGFDVLGMHVRLKPRRSNPTRLFCSRWPSTQAMPSIRHTIREAIGHDDLYSLDDKIRALNPLLRGGGQSFRISNAHRHFKKIDSDVHTKLVNCLRRKHTRRGPGFREGPPSCFTQAGLYQLHGPIVRVFRMPRGERGRKAE